MCKDLWSRGSKSGCEAKQAQKLNSFGKGAQHDVPYWGCDTWIQDQHCLYWGQVASRPMLVAVGCDTLRHAGIAVQVSISYEMSALSSNL